MRNIAVGYIFVSITILLLVPQSITIGTANIYIPHGIVTFFEASKLVILFIK